MNIPRPMRSGFRLKSSSRTKLRRTLLINTEGQRVRLGNPAIRAIARTLTSLASLDMLAPPKSSARITLAQYLEIDAEKLRKNDKNLRFMSKLFADLEEEKLYGLSLYLSKATADRQSSDHNPDLSNATSRVDEIYRTLKLIAAKPGWFGDVVASIKMDPNRKQQDLWLYHTLDELCDILKKRNVIVTRNQDSVPFGLLMDALSLVRPGIIPAQIESYLKETRQGLGKSSFGRRWGEIEEDLPNAEIAPSQLSDLDPGAGSDRHPSSTT